MNLSVTLVRWVDNESTHYCWHCRQHVQSGHRHEHFLSLENFLRISDRQRDINEAMRKSGLG